VARVQVLTRRELLGLLRGLGLQRIRERLRLVELERDERELLLGDLYLIEELVGFGLRVRLFVGAGRRSRVGLITTAWNWLATAW